MKIILSMFLVCLCFICSCLCQENKGWQGIVPLHSRRSDVKRLLGTPERMRKSSELFVTPYEKIVVNYAVKNCYGVPMGWNVSTNTVLSILVIPKQKIKSDTMNLTKGFIKSGVNDDLSIDYIDSNEGIKYTVNQFGNISTIYYMPPEKDESLKCK